MTITCTERLSSTRNGNVECVVCREVSASCIAMSDRGRSNRAWRWNRAIFRSGRSPLESTHPAAVQLRQSAMCVHVEEVQGICPSPTQTDRVALCSTSFTPSDGDSRKLVRLLRPLEARSARLPLLLRGAAFRGVRSEGGVKGGVSTPKRCGLCPPANSSSLGPESRPQTALMLQQVTSRST